MKAEQRIKMAMKQLANPSERLALIGELHLQTRAIASVLDDIIARQNRIASHSRMDEEA